MCNSDSSDDSLRLYFDFRFEGYEGYWSELKRNPNTKIDSLREIYCIFFATLFQWSSNFRSWSFEKNEIQILKQKDTYGMIADTRDIEWFSFRTIHIVTNSTSTLKLMRLHDVSTCLVSSFISCTHVYPSKLKIWLTVRQYKCYFFDHQLIRINIFQKRWLPVSRTVLQRIGYEDMSL